MNSAGAFAAVAGMVRTPARMAVASAAVLGFSCYPYTAPPVFSGLSGFYNQHNIEKLAQSREEMTA